MVRRNTKCNNHEIHFTYHFFFQLITMARSKWDYINKSWNSSYSFYFDVDSRIQSLSQRKLWKIQFFVHQQGCSILMSLLGLKACAPVSQILFTFCQKFSKWPPYGAQIFLRNTLLKQWIFCKYQYILRLFGSKAMWQSILHNRYNQILLHIGITS